MSLTQKSTIEFSKKSANSTLLKMEDYYTAKGGTCQEINQKQSYIDGAIEMQRVMADVNSITGKEDIPKSSRA